MNLLHHRRPHATRQRTINRMRVFMVIIPVCLLVLFSVFLYVGAYSYKAYVTARGLQSSINAIKEYSYNKDFNAVGQELKQAEKKVVELQGTLDHLSWFSYVPYVDKQYNATRALLPIGAALIQDGQKGISIVQELAKALDPNAKITSIRDLSEDQKGILLGIIARETKTLHEIEADLITQSQALSAIDTTYLHPELVSIINQAKEPMKEITNFLEILSPLLETTPLILGYPQQKTYLFLMQNNTEVRATGGFIGNYGILKLHNGEIKEFVTDNVYNLDDAAMSLQVAPPVAFAKYFKTNQWFLRDSNWSPDFSESAKKAIWFYNKEGGKEQIDGVITITQDFIVSLLRYVGPIEVEGIVFTAENFAQELQYQVEKGFYHKGIAERDRKEIIGTLSDRMLQRFYKLPSNRLPDVFSTITRLVQERHLMVYFKDPYLQEYARTQNWTGEFRKTDGDFVMVVDSNMGALKTDVVMEKHIDYTVRENNDGTLSAMVDLYYTNNGTFTWFTTRYRDWVRIYVPEGSMFVKSQGAMVKELSNEEGVIEKGTELDKTYFGAYIVVEPQTTKHFRVEYILPPRIAQSIRDGRYHLTAQKQSGVSNQQFKATLFFQRPIVNYSPTGFFNTKTGINNVQFQSDLRIDRFFSVMF